MTVFFIPVGASTLTVRYNVTINGATETYVKTADISRDGLKITAGSNKGASYTDYGDVTISSLSYPDAKASGETVSPTIEYTQSKTTGRSATSSRSAEFTVTVTLNGQSNSKTLTFTQDADGGSSTTSDCSLSVNYSTVTANAAATLNTTNGQVTWSANTSTTSTRSTTIRTTVTGEGGKTAAKDATSTQDKKEDEYEYIVVVD